MIYSECISFTGSSGCVTLRVTVSVDFSGTLRPTTSASEISIGVIPLPNHQTTWQELDSHLYRLFSVCFFFNLFSYMYFFSQQLLVLIRRYDVEVFQLASFISPTKFLLVYTGKASSTSYFSISGESCCCYDMEIS